MCPSGFQPCSRAEILRPVLINAHYEKHVDQLVELAGRFAAALSQAGIEYRIVGGFAVYLHVNKVDPLAARLTRDIDAAIKRTDLEANRAGCEAVRTGVQACSKHGHAG